MAVVTLLAVNFLLVLILSRELGPGDLIFDLDTVAVILIYLLVICLVGAVLGGAVASVLVLFGTPTKLSGFLHGSVVALAAMLALIALSGRDNIRSITTSVADSPSTAAQDAKAAELLGECLAGTIEWFNDTKGYGFITPGDGGEQVFVHVSQLDGYEPGKVLAGQEVRFDLDRDAGGRLAAVNVTIGQDCKVAKSE